jgi:hypothetical protein
MPNPRNPNNMAIDLAAQMGVDLVEFFKKNFPERLGDDPVPQRQRKIGDVPMAPIVEEIVQLVPPQGGIQ